MRTNLKKTFALAAGLSLLASAALAQVPSFQQPPLQRATFAAGFNALAFPQTGAGDAVCLVGSATKTIYVVRVEWNALKTTADVAKTVSLVKRTVANTGGTSSAATATKLDSLSGVATAALNGYTVIPTPGAGTNVRSQVAAFPAASAGPSALIIWDWNNTISLSQPVVLRGVAQSLCINFPAAFTTDGPAITAEFTWTEQ